MNKEILCFLLMLFGVAIMIASAVTASFFPEKPLVWQICLGVGVGCIIGWITLRFKMLVELFSKRTVRYGINSILIGIFGLAIAVVINLIAKEYDVKHDMTKNKIHTLAEQSIKVLEGLKDPVTIHLVIKPVQLGAYLTAFEKFTDHTDQLKIQMIDMDRDIGLLRQHKISREGTIIVESKTRSTKIDSLRDGPVDVAFEQKITNALIKVAKGEKRKIYFTSGHGEHGLDDATGAGLSMAKEELQLGRYNVASLVLMEKPNVPADADLVVVAGPKSDFMPHELKAIEKYVKEGGRLLLMVNPDSTKTLQPLLKKYGAVWNPRKVVVETSLAGQMRGGPLVPVISDWDRNHPITRDNKKGDLGVFRVSTPIEKSDKVSADLKIIRLFSTQSSAALLTLPRGTNRLRLDEKAMKKRGSFNLALAVKGPAEKGKPKEAKKAKQDKKEDKDKTEKEKAEAEKEGEFRVVIVGDSAFASNANRRYGINADLFQNMLSWLAQEEDLIAMRPRPINTSKFDITEARMLAIFWISVAFAPLIMLLAGFMVWFARRKK